MVKRYKVQYTNPRGKKVSRVIRAIRADNAWLTAKVQYKGKGIKVNKLG